MQEQLTGRDAFFQVYRWLNLFLVILLPAYAMLNGLTTVFYIVYLYWWHELISSTLDAFYLYLHKKRNPDVHIKSPYRGRLFVLAIYFVFIVILFGFVTDWRNRDLLVMNLRVLMLNDLFFVVNLACLFLNEWWIRYRYAKKYDVAQNPFAGRMIVLHVSIIGGAVMYFWLSQEFPKTFGPGNLWGSVIIAAPFLLAKAILTWNDRQLPETVTS
jgi:hypothetical protein